MSTTTIRIPVDLKERLSKVADNLGSTSHALILDAITERVEAEECRNEIRETAEKHYDRMRLYLNAQVSGRQASRPKPRKLSR